MKAFIPAVALLLLANAAHASILPGYTDSSLSVVINETGAPVANGQVLTGFVGSDGNTAYTLPFGVTPGDVLINEPGSDGFPGIRSDVLRFTPISGSDLTNLMTFYSDGEQDDSPRDLGLPSDVLANNTSIIEPTSEHMNYMAGAACYSIQSDSVVETSAVPEPSGLALLMTGGLPLLGLLRRRMGI